MERLTLTAEEITVIVSEERESGSDINRIQEEIAKLENEIVQIGGVDPGYMRRGEDLVEALRRCYLAGYRRAYEVYSASLEELTA